MYITAHTIVAYGVKVGRFAAIVLVVTNDPRQFGVWFPLGPNMVELMSQMLRVGVYYQAQQ